MKFVIPSTELLSQLQLMSKVMNSKNTLPILDYILLQLKDDKLTVMASDLETTLVSELEVPNVQQEGSVAVPKLLADTLKEFPEQPLTVIVNQETYVIEISWATGKVNIPGYNPQDFPEIPKLKSGATAMPIPAEALNDAIGKTLFATANDELRPVMNGVFFDMTSDSATFVASDAHKLVRYRRTDVKPGSSASFILPKKPAALLRTILAKESSAVELEFDEKNASFILPNYKLVCRLIEGVFPAYDSVIPQDNPNKLTVDRLEMLTVVKRISTLAPAGTSLIKLKCTANQLTVSAQDLDFSYSGAERIVCQYDGEELEMGFKSSFLVEILSNLGSREVVLELANPGRAGLILPVGEASENEDTLMLLMPMMIN
ncbi:MAG: DNA polymerase III subunit beta [Prevotellaceae bacterium]|jgi:DNA polymerase-3 subunit beta|nr:DNA polymerase III subunit beta [Prevotellaceae bacterium]